MAGAGSPGSPAAGAGSPGSPAAGNGSPVAPALPGLPASSSSLTAGAASAIGLFATLCLGPLTPVCPMPFSPDNCHTTPISPSPR